MLFRTNRRFYGRLVRLFCTRIPEGQSRWGIMVGKKLVGAAGRVRGRRVLRECARRLAPLTKEGYLIGVSLTREGLNAKAPQLWQDLVFCLRSAHLLVAEPEVPWNDCKNPDKDR